MQFLGWASSELTVPRPITAPRWMQPTLDPSRREASSRVVCSSVYGVRGGAVTVDWGEEKMFSKHFHSLNEFADKSAAAEGRAADLNR